MDFPKEIFRAYDIRGLLDQVTPELAEQVGRIIVMKLGSKKILLGRDMRTTTPELAAAFIKGVTEAGGHILDIGMTTTSMFKWATLNTGVDHGVMITASHNPAEYNGIKMATSTGEAISGEQIHELLPAAELGEVNEKGEVQEVNVVDRYLDAVVEIAGKLPDLSSVKIVVDYGNGMGSVTVGPLLRRLGLDPVELYAEPDGTFPNHEANPSKEETLVDLKQAVLEQEADFGVATDGDADRIFFIDDSGKTIRGDQMLALLVEYFTVKKGSSVKVVTAPNMGKASIDYMKAHDAEIIEERIGYKFIIAKMREKKADLSGEVSGHFFFPEFKELETVDYTLLLFIKLWKESGKTTAELAAPLRGYVNSGEVNIPIKDKLKTVEAIKSHYSNSATSVNEIDGIKCEFGEEWWFIARPSNGEPLVRITVEAKDASIVQEKVKELSELVKSI